MHWSQNLRKLHVDLTSYCNAKCPACARNLNGGPTTPGLALEHFEVDVWRRVDSIICHCAKQVSL